MANVRIIIYTLNCSYIIYIDRDREREINKCFQMLATKAKSLSYWIVVHKLSRIQIPIKYAILELANSRLDARKCSRIWWIWPNLTHNHTDTIEHIYCTEAIRNLQPWHAVRILCDTLNRVRFLRYWNLYILLGLFLSSWIIKKNRGLYIQMTVIETTKSNSNSLRT